MNPEMLIQSLALLVAKQARRLSKIGEAKDQVEAVAAMKFLSDN